MSYSISDASKESVSEIQRLPDLIIAILLSYKLGITQIWWCYHAIQGSSQLKYALDET